MSESAEIAGTASGSISSEGSTSETVVNEAEISELEQSINEAPAPKKYKVKIDGQDLEVAEDELLQGYQTNKAAQQRFNEAARMRKQAEEFVRIAKTDPKRLLSHPDIGIDMLAFARDILAEQMEEEMLSPQEKELRNREKRLEEFERQQRSQEEALRASEVEKYTKQYEEEYSNGIVEALQISGLPKSPKTVAAIAKKMKEAMEAGFDVKPVDVVRFVKRDYIEEIKSLFGSADADTILSMIGDDISTKVVKGHLNKAKKGKTIPQMTQATQPVTPKTTTKAKPMSRDEWRDAIAKRVRGS